MRRMTMLLISVFVVALGAGVVAGMLASRLPAAGAPENSDNTWLPEKLQLSPQQQEQMRGIWENATDTVHNCSDNRARLQKDFDEAVFEMLSPEQKARHNDLRNEYQKRIKILEADQAAAFNRAVAQTNRILTPEQQKKYQQILNERLGQQQNLLGEPSLKGIAPTTQDSR